MNSHKNFDTDEIIADAGPVGLTIGGALRQFDNDCLMLEQRTAVKPNSWADNEQCSDISKEAGR